MISNQRISRRNTGVELFVRDKPIDLLLCLTDNIREKYPSNLAKEAKCTYSHTVHLLQKMEKLSLVKFEKKGRLKLVALTQKGDKVASLFKDVKRSF